MLFPALLVLTTLLAQVREGPTLVGEIRSVFEQFLAYRHDGSSAVVPSEPASLLRPVDSVRYRAEHLRWPGHDAVTDGGLSAGVSDSS